MASDTTPCPLLQSLCGGGGRGRGRSPNTPTTGLRERGNDTSKSTGHSGRQKAATRHNMRREERGPAGFNRTWVRRTCRLGVPVGSAYFRPADRPAESPAVPSARRLGRPKVRPYLRPADWPAESTAVPSASRSAGRKYGRTFGRPIGRPKVRFNPSPPLVLKGPQARRYTQKAVHTKGGVWPPQESCY